jgi:hypothetical protein
VPKPASSPLLVIYPVGWAIGATVWFFAGADARAEADHRSAAESICARTREAGATPMSTAEWLPHMRAQYGQHAALVPPQSLRAAHAELLAIERADLAVGEQLAVAQQSGDRRAAGPLVRRAYELLKRRERVAQTAGLPGCG